MRMRFVWLAGAVVLAGNFPKPESAQASSIVPAFAPTPTPAPTSSEIPSPAETPAAAVSPTPLVRPTPLPVVPYEKLISFLPATPRGWTAEKPDGSTNEIEIFNLSTASQTYQNGSEDNAPVVTVTIIEAGGHKGYFEATTVLWKTAETPEGYDKTVEIDGIPGYEHFNKFANSGSLAVVVAKRYFIQIEVTNLDPKELRTWLKKIDLKKLAELK